MGQIRNSWPAHLTQLPLTGARQSEEQIQEETLIVVAKQVNSPLVVLQFE